MGFRGRVLSWARGGNEGVCRELGMGMKVCVMSSGWGMKENEGVCGVRE